MRHYGSVGDPSGKTIMLRVLKSFRFMKQCFRESVFFSNPLILIFTIWRKVLWNDVLFNHGNYFRSSNFFLLRLEKSNCLISKKKCALDAKSLFWYNNWEITYLLDTHLRFYFLVNFPYVCFSTRYRSYTYVVLYFEQISIDYFCKNDQAIENFYWHIKGVILVPNLYEK